MPELPDIEAYRNALGRAIGGAHLTSIELLHPFLLRSVGVPPEAAVGGSVSRVDRMGKRIVIALDNGLALAIHLMIAGRLAWKPGETSGSSRRTPARGSKSGVLGVFGFSTGTVLLTEAGSKRRASLHVLHDGEELEALNPRGMELLAPGASAEEFARRLREENHTIKRSLTDPRLYSGIGNSFSDEILFAACLSPFAMSASLTDDEVARLFTATVSTLTEWRDRLIVESEHGFPKKVTAFRPEMHVHGKYGQPCTACGTPIQRIRYAENECNYCPTCQTGGKIYADRALSRLLKGDWPRTVEELEKLSRPPGA